MIGLNLLVGEIIFEAVRFILMLVLLVCAAFLGSKLRTLSDKRKADKKAKESDNLIE